MIRLRSGRYIRICMFVFFMIGGFSIANGQSPLEYHDFSSMQNLLLNAGKNNPDILTVETIGRSLENREIYAARLTAPGDIVKPALLVVGGVEGGDIAASEICLQIIENIAQAYGEIDSVTRVLDRFVLYVLPRVNPDATEFYFSQPRYFRTLNSRALDLDTDGSVSEDHYDDLNNDGFITLMRIRDARGSWIQDTSFPELLRKADPEKNETGKYLLYSEGIDNDKDGNWNEDEIGGVNFNQNFTYKYKLFQKGTGPHQVSEQITRAVADFAFEHKNISAVFTFSPNDNLLHPWKSKPGNGGSEGDQPITNVLSPDATYLNRLADQFKAITALENSPEPKRGNGSFAEWAYFHYGRWSLSVPAWWPPLSLEEADSTVAGQSGSSEKPETERSQHFKNQVQLLNWLRSTKQMDAFIPWAAIDHPDFPDRQVEVGGFKPYVAINPPQDSLAPIASRFEKYLLQVAQQLPQISLGNLTVEALDKNVFRVTLSVTNRGYLPTVTEIGTQNQWAPKVTVELKLTGDQELVGGNVSTIINKIEGAGGSEELSWLVMGKKGTAITVEAGSPMTGYESREIRL